MDTFDGDGSGDETLNSHALENGHDSTVELLTTELVPGRPLDTSVVMEAGGGLGDAMTTNLPQLLMLMLNSINDTLLVSNIDVEL